MSTEGREEAAPTFSATIDTSKPLRDFIYESNNGKHFFFTASREEALERLARAN
nr:DUF4180 domain-containing protein [uncultured Oscillibacter sp.]